MAVFRYRAIDRAGAVVTGTLESPDAAAAAQRLHETGHMPIRIEAGAGGLRALLDTEITPRDAISERDRLVFTRALATLAGAGLPLDRALAIARDLGERRAVREVAGRLLEAVQGGASFADALDRERAAFPPLYRAVVRAGETGAALEATLARLADQLETGARRRGELRSAMIYPAFLLLTAAGSVALLLGFVVPSFEPLLAEAEVEPPAITQAVIAAGRVVEAWWAALLGGALLALAGGRLALLAPRLRLAWHRALLGTPVVGPLWASFETARLARLLSGLLENGVALPAALRLARGALGNRAFAAELDRVIPEVEAGRGLAAPFAEGRVLPPLAKQLLRVGQDSGQLAEMLGRIAAIFEAESTGRFDRLLAILTPAITLLMGVLIAVVISSILFALFSINELAI